MIIGIDGNEANVSKQVGVSVYTSNLLKYFQKKADNNTQFRVYLRHKPTLILPPENEHYKYVVVTGPFLWSQLFLPLHLNLHKTIDIFFSPAHYSPRYCPVPLVVTIHDLSYFYFPDEFLKKDFYKLKNWTEYSLTKAKSIISVSKSTKKDIMKYYQIPDERIKVIYNGFEKDIQDEAMPDANFLIMHDLTARKYILYVGTLQPRKNIPTLIKAFAKFKIQNPDFKLVITGKKGWLYESIFEEAKKQQVNDSVIFTGFIPDTDIASLYKNAFCLVFPSLYEGFGLPLLEAMSFGCPVISSHSSSLPEIGGDACLYFDSTDEKDLLADLELLKKDQSIYDELIAKGKERIKLFSWEKCAEETLQTIQNAIITT